MNLELPKIIGDWPRLIEVLNDRLRQIGNGLRLRRLEGDLDGQGFRLTNIANPQKATDALTLGVADLRYQPKGAVQKNIESTPEVAEPVVIPDQIAEHRAILLDMTVGTDILSHRFRWAIPGGKRFFLLRIQATTKSATSSTLSVKVWRRRTTVAAWAECFTVTIASGETQGDTEAFDIAEFYQNDELRYDVISNGGATNCEIAWRGEYR